MHVGLAERVNVDGAEELGGDVRLRRAPGWRERGVSERWRGEAESAKRSDGTATAKRSDETGSAKPRDETGAASGGTTRDGRGRAATWVARTSTRAR